MAKSQRANYGVPAARPCRIPDWRAQLPPDQTKISRFTREARVKKRFNSLRLLQACHNCAHDGLADGGSCG
jgi:hypothetical protein